MSTKHFATDIDQLVVDCLDYLTLSNPTLKYYKSDKVVAYTQHDGNKNVSVVSGGGAGHEPAHAGFVGAGMLTAAVSGWIFASPSVPQITAGIHHVGGSKGTLLIIKNYTGDIFHFSLAAEKARAQGRPTAVVVVGDDVAVGRKKSGKVGRRGLAGTTLVHKVAGAVAADPASSLADVVKAAQDVADNLVTVGVSLNHVHIPGRAIEKENILGESEVEVGLGIHNEAGCQRLSPIPPLPSLVTSLLDQLLDQNDKDRAYVDFSDAESVVLMVNNLGGLSPLELGAISAETLKQLSARTDIRYPDRVATGTYMTSLDGPGFSLTLLKTTKCVLPMLDSSVGASGWTPICKTASVDSAERVIIEATTKTEIAPASGTLIDVSAFKSMLSNACDRVIAAEGLITKYDTIVGDGDCGYTLKRAAEAVLGYIKGEVPKSVNAVIELADTVEDNMDGTSGAIFGIYLNALAASCAEVHDGSDTPLDTAGWSKAGLGALEKLLKATPARVGDRTLIDALDPFVRTLAETNSLSKAATAAKAGCDSTQGMRASLGRAVYVSESGYDRVPDPGAMGIAAIAEGLAQ
ncbi:Dak1 domain-containing protein [Dipodascopsis tothii]|uniref:Dak1 domain-containing protein n=1 Tax=Dipodascopsis tothii TaxID=44089 RepID=UPI0034CD7DD8